MSAQLVAREEPAPVAEGATLLAVISRAAADPGTDVEKMERLMAMYERVEAKRAETAFNDAMNEAQSKIGRIAADRENSQTHSWYATYAMLDRNLRPVYTGCGFSLSFDTAAAAENLVHVICYVSHKAGHTRTYNAVVPSDGKGAKGNDVMTKTHAFGSGAQYGMRYLLKMIFNVAIGVDPDDDDGNGASSETDSEAHKIELAWVKTISEAKTLEQHAATRQSVIDDYKGSSNVPEVLRKALTARKRELTPPE